MKGGLDLCQKQHPADADKLVEHFGKDPFGTNTKGMSSWRYCYY